jgi:hypothetical protein
MPREVRAKALSVPLSSELFWSAVASGILCDTAFAEDLGRGTLDMGDKRSQTGKSAPLSRSWATPSSFSARRSIPPSVYSRVRRMSSPRKIYGFCVKIFDKP